MNPLLPTSQVYDTKNFESVLSHLIGNVIVKIVLKVLENRLKPLIAKLTGQCQYSFILGRSTMNNIVVA